MIDGNTQAEIDCDTDTDHLDKNAKRAARR